MDQEVIAGLLSAAAVLMRAVALELRRRRRLEELSGAGQPANSI